MPRKLSADALAEAEYRVFSKPADLESIRKRYAALETRPPVAAG